MDHKVKLIVKKTIANSTHNTIYQMITKILNIFVLIIFIYSGGLPANDNGLKQGRGPFKIRNQFPMNQQFLSFSADHAFTLPGDYFRLRLFYSHANTFAQSHGVLNTINRSTSRSLLSDQSSFFENSSNHYIIDTGSSRLSMNLEYGISDQFTLELEIPYISYHGGFLDTPIEFVHQWAGFPYANRSFLVQNTTQIFLSNKRNETYFNSNDLSGSGIGDIILMAKGQIFESITQGFALSSRIAIKLPTGNYQYLRGSGSIDFGVDLTLTKRWGHSILNSNISYVIPGKWKLRPEQQMRHSYSWILSYEYLFGKKISIVLQNLIQSSYFTGQINQEISKPIFEWTAGIKYDIGKRYRLSFAITENYIYHNNTADFGFHIGLTRGF
jgi:hypothetical protein